MLAADLPPAHPIVRFVQETRAAIIDASPYLGQFLAASPGIGRVAMFEGNATHLAMASGVPGVAEVSALHYFSDRRIVFSRPVARELERVATRRATADGLDMAAVKTLIHEHLHSISGERAVHDRGDTLIEEGVVEAVAYDLLPAVVRRVGRGQAFARDSIGPNYTRCVIAARMVSTHMAGLSGRNAWTTRSARRMRVALLTASLDDRRAAYSAAGLDPRASC